jgi:hypothetical protein
MDFEPFNNEFLNQSPLPNLWLSSPPAATAIPLTNEPESHDSLDDNSEDDDGLYDHASPGECRDDCSEGGFSDEEQVVEAAEQYCWKIDHGKGDHKFKGMFMCI